MPEHAFDEFSCKRFATPTTTTTSDAPFGALV